MHVVPKKYGHKKGNWSAYSNNTIYNLQIAVQLFVCIRNNNTYVIALFFELIY